MKSISSLFFDWNYLQSVMRTTVLTLNCPPRAGIFISMPNEITIVLKNRMYSNAVVMALLSAGFEKTGAEYLHDGVHIHLKPPGGSQNGV